MVGDTLMKYWSDVLIKIALVVFFAGGFFASLNTGFKVDSYRKEVNQKFEEVYTRLDRIEERLLRIEVRLDEMDKRVVRLENKK